MVYLAILHFLVSLLWYFASIKQPILSCILKHSHYDRIWIIFTTFTSLVFGKVLNLLEQLLCFGVSFHCCKWPNIEHMVTQNTSLVGQVLWCSSNTRYIQSDSDNENFQNLFANCIEIDGDNNLKNDKNRSHKNRQTTIVLKIPIEAHSCEFVIFRNL